MVKVIIPNTDGHYEINGIEVDVGRQIVIRTYSNDKPKTAIHENGKERPDRNERHDDFRDPGNSSLLSSIVKIRDKIIKK